MKCPACDSEEVYRSRARSTGDRLVKRLLPVSFYRCHDCGWRRARLQQVTLKGATRHTLSLAGYIGGAGLVLAVIAGAIMLTLTFLGVPMPWTR